MKEILTTILLMLVGGFTALGVVGIFERAECEAVVTERVDVPRYQEEHYHPKLQHKLTGDHYIAIGYVLININKGVRNV